MKKSLIKTFLAFLIFIGIQNFAMANVIRFAQVTDVHYSDESPYPAEILKKTVADLNQQKDLSFVIFTGDNIDSPKPKYLQGFMAIIKNLDIPYYMVIGNHDVFKNGNLSKAQYIDTIRDLDAAYKPKHQNYVFKKDGFVFIVVDGAKEIIPNAVGYYKKDTLDWLEKQLTKYKKSPVIIAQHYPIVPPKVSKSHETYKKEEYLARLDKYDNVVAVISGHYHMNAEQMRNGVYHISSPSLIVPPNYYKIIEISTTKGFSPLIYTELRAISPTED